MGKRHVCHYKGCKREATCLPRLYVPASTMSFNRSAQDISALLGLPVCETCFSKLTAKEFLQGERGEVIRANVTLEFRKRDAVPNFDKAVIGRVSERDMDFGRFEKLEERARAN